MRCSIAGAVLQPSLGVSSLDLGRPPGRSLFRAKPSVSILDTRPRPIRTRARRARFTEGPVWARTLIGAGTTGSAGLSLEPLPCTLLLAQIKVPSFHPRHG